MDLLFWWIAGIPALGTLLVVLWFLHKLPLMPVDRAIDDELRRHTKRNLELSLAQYDSFKTTEAGRPLPATPLHHARQEAQFLLREARAAEALAILTEEGMTSDEAQSFCRAYLEDREREALADTSIAKTPKDCFARKASASKG